MSRTLEAIFRRPLRLLLLIVLLPLVSLAIAYVLPRPSQATASLWALRRYEVIGATGPESDLLATPAETQTTALTELLQTRAFALGIANATDLASTLDPSVQADIGVRNDTLFDIIAHQVQVSSGGYNLFTVTYTNTDSQVAKQVVTAVIQAYASQSVAFSTVEAQRLLDNYQKQLTTAQRDVDAAVKIEAQYLHTHPKLSQNNLSNDPEYAQLHAQTEQTQAKVTTIQNQIATLNGEISTQGLSADSFFRVLDIPAVRPVSRVKLLLTAGGIGLGAGLLACALYIALLVRRDRALYTARDLQKVATDSPIIQLPRLTSTAVSLLLSGKKWTSHSIPLDECKESA